HLGTTIASGSSGQFEHSHTGTPSRASLRPSGNVNKPSLTQSLSLCPGYKVATEPAVVVSLRDSYGDSGGGNSSPRPVPDRFFHPELVRECLRALLKQPGATRPVRGKSNSF